jgi:hypothetical protein
MLKKHLNVTDKHHSNIVNYLNAKQCKQIIIFKKVGKSARQVTAVSFTHAKTNNHFLYPSNLRIKFYLDPCFSSLMLTCNKTTLCENLLQPTKAQKATVNSVKTNNSKSDSEHALVPKLITADATVSVR